MNLIGQFFVVGSPGIHGKQGFLNKILSVYQVVLFHLPYVVCLVLA